MNEEKLPYFAAKYIYAEDEELRNQAEEAWKLVIEKGKEIEAQAMQGEFEVPEDAMTGEQLLEALMKRADEKKKQNME